MQRLEVSGAARLIYRSLGVKGLRASSSVFKYFLLRKWNDDIVLTKNGNAAQRQ